MKKRDSRVLDIQKASRVRVSTGIPHRNEGQDGDLAISEFRNEIKMYIKYKGSWHGVSVGKAFDDIRDKANNAISKQDKKPLRMQLSTNKIHSDNDFTLDSSGDIELNADGGQVAIKDGAASHFLLDCDNTAFTIYDDTDAADLFKITVGASGVTTIATVDDGAAVGHLSLQPDGDLILDPVSKKTIINAQDGLYLDGGGDTYIVEHSADLLRFIVGGNAILSLSEAGGGTSDKVSILATTGLYFDGGGDTYIYEASTDVVRHVVGGDILLALTENGTDGNTVSFRTACAGFTQLVPTFDGTATTVDFRHSNKQKLTLTGNITNIYFQFPDISGNFLCVFLQDGTGSWDVTNWRTKDSAGNAGAGNGGAVLWANATAPSLTETADKADIVSIYWDNDNEIAYGTFVSNF